jgi:hypothetical protein
MEKKVLAPKRKRKIKKRKVIKGKGRITKQTKTGKGGNVSQVVNVYVSKANRRRVTAPKQFKPAIQPDMYNAGQEGIISGLTQQNKTLLSILDKQRKADTTPNSDIKTLKDLVNNKGKEKINTDGLNVVGIEELDDFEDLTATPPPSGTSSQAVRSVSTTRRPINTPPQVRRQTENISNMLSSIADGMDEIPRGEEIKNRIISIGQQLQPSGVRTRIAEINELDERGKLELDYDDLVKQLQEQRKYDDTIRMANYTNRLPTKTSTLKNKVAEMRNILERSIENMGSQAL